MSGFKVGGTDLDAFFSGGSGGGATGFLNAGVDLNARYAPYSSGTKPGDLGFKIGGSDVQHRFQPSGGGAGPINPIGGGDTAASFTLFPTAAYAEYVLAPDGNVTMTNGIPGNWYSPITAGIGNTHWVRFTDLSGSHAGAVPPSGGSGALGAWQQMNVNRYVYLTRAAVGFDYSMVLVQISTAASDASIVSSRTVQLACTVDI